MNGLLSSIYELLKGMRGTDWTSSDSLRKIAAEVRDINQTAVADAVVFDSKAYTRDMIFNSLRIGKAGMVSAAGYDVVVLGDLVVRSGRFRCRNLYVYGNIDVDREIGDSAYSNIFAVEKLFCIGSCSLKYALKESAPAHVAVGGDYYEYDCGIYSLLLDCVNSSVYPKIFVLGSMTKAFSSQGVWGTPKGGYLFSAICRVNKNITLKKVTINVRGGVSISEGDILLVDYVNIDDEADIGTFACHYASKVGNFDYSLWNLAPAANHSEVTGLASLHAPGMIAVITPPGAWSNALAWNTPMDINGDTLQFRIEVEEKYNDLSFVKVIDQTSISNPDQFSGTKPYPSGSGNVVYSIPPATLVNDKTYRWRVTAQKATDSSVISIPSEWRSFIYA